VVVRIFRYDPLCNESPHYEDFEIPDSFSKGATVMDVLSYISRKLDPSLGFFSHSRCNRGVCKRCLVRRNGRVVVACDSPIDEFSPGVNAGGVNVKGMKEKPGVVVLEPVSKGRIVKDLLVEGL